jgi:hypothetical protein
VTCPKCKNDSAHRSHRRGLVEWLASLAAVYPYRCPQCDLRFLRFKYSTVQPEPSGVEQEIRNTRRSVRWKRRKRELLLYALGLLVFLAFLYFITRDRNSGNESGASCAPSPQSPVTHCV